MNNSVDSPIHEIRTLLKDSSIYGLINAARMSIGFFLLPVFTRFFTIDEFGVFEMILATTAVINILFSLNLTSGLARHFYEKEEQRVRLVSTGLIFMVLITLIFLPLIPILASFLSDFLFKSQLYNQVIIIALLTIPLHALLVYMEIVLRLEKKFKEYFIIQVGALLLIFISSIIFIVHMNLGIISFFYAQLISFGTFTLVALYFIRRFVSHNFRLRILKNFLLYSVPAVPAVVGNWANKFIDRYFIFFLIGISGVGAYGVGAKVSLAIGFLVTAFRMGWLPLAMSLIGNPSQKETYRKVLTYYSITLFSLAALITIFSKDIIQILATGEYIEGFKVVGFLIGASVLHGSMSIVFVGAYVTKRTYINTIAIGAAVFVNMLLMWLLIPKIGIFGAAVSSFIGFFLANVIGYTFSQRYIPINYEFSKIIKVLLGYILICILVIPVSSIENVLLQYGIKVGILLCYYLIIFSLLEEKEVEMVKTITRDGYDRAVNFFYKL